MESKNNPSFDPQQDILLGHGAFGVDYIPKTRRARVVDGWVYGGKTSEIPPGKAKAIALDRFTIALFRTGEAGNEFYAIKDACPHADYPLSKSMLVSPYVVMCTSHNWRFDVRNGRCVRIGKCGHIGRALQVRVFPLRIEGEEIWIQVENPKEKGLGSGQDTLDSP